MKNEKNINNKTKNYNVKKYILIFIIVLLFILSAIFLYYFLKTLKKELYIKNNVFLLVYYCSIIWKL